MFRFAENSRCRENKIPAFAPPPFHSREGGNLPVCWGEQRSHRIVFLQLEGREIPAFAGMGVGEIKEKAAANSTHPSIPAKAGISAAKPHSPKANIAMFRFAENSRCCENEIPAFAPPPFHSREGGNLPVCWGEQRSHRIVFLQLEGREIPAFAGMGVGEIKEKAAANSTHPSIPAKAGISAAKPHSPKATIAMFRFAENSRCCENEIPAFAGMERLVEAGGYFVAGKINSPGSFAPQ